MFYLVAFNYSDHPTTWDILEGHPAGWYKIASGTKELCEKCQSKAIEQSR